MKKLFVTLFVLVLCISGNAAEKNAKNNIGVIGGYLGANCIRTKLYGGRTPAEQIDFIRRKAPNIQAHGFYAEQGNNVIDRLHGINAEVIGDDFAKNGADRKIIGRNGKVTYIQTKYCKTAWQSVDAAFDSNGYRYIDAVTKKPMQLEVPKDQYKNAVYYMKQKIAEGKVLGVKNPIEAYKIVKEGHLTYQQSVNLTKAGTIESLRYDAIGGAITCVSALGIGFAFDYVLSRMNGASRLDSLRNASLNSLKAGAICFAGYVLSAQLARTIIGRFVSANVILSTMFFLGLTIKDVYRVFTNQITWKDFLYCTIINAVSLSLATGGAWIGGALGSVFGPAGTAIGAITGGLVGGAITYIATHVYYKKKYERDAEQMYSILNNCIARLSEDYLITESELNRIIQTIKNDKNFTRNMFNSSNRYNYAMRYLEPLFEQQLRNKQYIQMPSERDVRNEYRKTMCGYVYNY